MMRGGPAPTVPAGSGGTHYPAAHGGMGTHYEVTLTRTLTLTLTLTRTLTLTLTLTRMRTRRTTATRSTRTRRASRPTRTRRSTRRRRAARRGPPRWAPRPDTNPNPNPNPNLSPSPNPNQGGLRGGGRRGPLRRRGARRRAPTKLRRAATAAGCTALVLHPDRLTGAEQPVRSAGGRSREGRCLSRGVSALAALGVCLNSQLTRDIVVKPIAVVD